MKLRMAMDKLKQALGMQITDDQLMALLRRDMDNADPFYDYVYAADVLADTKVDPMTNRLYSDNIARDPYQSEVTSGPIYEDLAEYPADEIAEAMQAGQGSLTASQPREGIALLAEMMADQELAEQVNQALLEKERMG